MEAKVKYNDFKGTAAADLSDDLVRYGDSDLERISKYFKLDEEKFKLVGISLYKLRKFQLVFICVDKKNSTEQEDKIVKLYYNEKYDEEAILDILFKRLEIVLYNRFDDKYSKIENYTEDDFSEHHR